MTEDALTRAAERLKAMPPYRDYDPELDITAGELRALGYEIPASTPDCGWVPRTAMRVEWGRPKASTTERGLRNVTLQGSLVFDQPFRWIEVKGTIEP